MNRCVGELLIDKRVPVPSRPPSASAWCHGKLKNVFASKPANLYTYTRHRNPPSHPHPHHILRASATLRANRQFVPKRLALRSVQACDRKWPSYHTEHSPLRYGQASVYAFSSARSLFRTFSPQVFQHRHTPPVHQHHPPQASRRLQASQPANANAYPERPGQQ